MLRSGPRKTRGLGEGQEEIFLLCLNLESQHAQFAFFSSRFYHLLLVAEGSKTVCVYFFK